MNTISVEWRQVTNIIFKTQKAAKKFDSNPNLDLIFDIDLCADENLALGVMPEIEFPQKLELGRDFSLVRTTNVCHLEVSFIFFLQHLKTD